MISLESERFAVTSTTEGKISAMESRELVHRFGLISFQEDARDLEVHRDALDNLVRKCGIGGFKTGVVISEDMVLVKRIPVALGLDESVLNDQMEWEADQLLLSPRSDFRLAYQRLPMNSSTGNPYYLMILMRKQVLRALRALVESAGLELHEIEVDIFSHLRSLQMNYLIQKDDMITLLRLHSSGMLFIFISQNDYYLSHRIDVPKFDQMESADLVSMIKKELRRLVFGHRLGKDIGDLKKLYVIGSAANDGLIQQMKSDIPISVEKMNPLKKLSLESDMAQSQEVLKFPERFSGTVGLLLKNHPQLIRG